MHTASSQQRLRRRRLQVGYDVIAAAAILVETRTGFSPGEIRWLQGKEIQDDDASKKVSDAQGRDRRQHRQVVVRGFRLRLPQPQPQTGSANQDVAAADAHLLQEGGAALRPTTP